MKYIQGKFKPRHPEKYVGDINNIQSRSSWEMKAMRFFDMNPSVLRWGSEELHVNYYSPVDERVRRYFPDMFIEYKNTKGEIVRALVEIKPFSQTLPPKPAKTKSPKAKARYIQEATTYVTNKAKWKAAEEFCQKHNMKFVILTEKELKI